MPKETLKRFMPSPGRLREIRSLQVLGEWIYQPRLWTITRHTSSAAFFVGLFMAFVPLPSQMILAAAASIWLRCNLPLAVALCWITNPLTIPPIFFLAYKVGATLLNITPQPVEFELSWEWLSTGMVAIWQPLLLGCLVCGLTFGSLGYLSINLLWRWNVTRQWQARRLRRKAALAKATHDVELRQAAIVQHAEQDKSQQESTSRKPPG
jgi:uncharacterized protein (DUF2062 family)